MMDIQELRKSWTSEEPCDEECCLFREGLCETERQDEMCNREFKPKSRCDADECSMYYPRQYRE